MFELQQTHQLWLYFVLVAGIVILPGMDMAFVMGSALAQGRRAGLAAVAGIVCGGIGHLVMGASGAGLLLLQAPRMYQALLVAGAAYVGWIGLGLWRSGASMGEVPAAGMPRRLGATFARACATCLLNPKAYVFMLAVFPQFLRAENGSLRTQAVALGLITAATQATVYGAVALGAARLRRGLDANPAGQRRLGRAVGALLIATAAWALVSGWPR